MDLNRVFPLKALEHCSTWDNLLQSRKQYIPNTIPWKSVAFQFVYSREKCSKINLKGSTPARRRTNLPPCQHLFLFCWNRLFLIDNFYSWTNRLIDSSQVNVDAVILKSSTRRPLEGDTSNWRPQTTISTTKQVNRSSKPVTLTLCPSVPGILCIPLNGDIRW